MLAKKSLWLPLVIGLEIILVSIYAITVHLNKGQPAPLFDVNGIRSLPSWLQTIQLFVLGALPLWTSITYLNQQVPASRSLLTVSGLFFLFASVDELFKLNSLFNQHELWKSVYLSFAIAIPLIFYRDLIRLYRLQPKAMRLIGIGILIFLAGGFGLELFRRHVQEPYWYELFGQWKFYQVDSIRTAIEEFGEMLGETLIIKGMLSLVRMRSHEQKSDKTNSIFP